MSHALTRTSPKGPGQQFLGTCIKCGLEDIPLSRMNEECVNVADITDGEALSILIQRHDQ